MNCMLCSSAIQNKVHSILCAGPNETSRKVFALSGMSSQVVMSLHTVRSVVDEANSTGSCTHCAGHVMLLCYRG